MNGTRFDMKVGTREMSGTHYRVKVGAREVGGTRCKMKVGTREMDGTGNKEGEVDRKSDFWQEIAAFGGRKRSAVIICG